VIPALIRKCLEAVASGRSEVEVWGSGTATREFLHVDDAARGIVLALERYDGPEPLNLGGGREISIRELAELIAAATGFVGRFSWDRSKPDGQPRRAVSGSRARSLVGWEPSIDLEDGLRQTAAWLREWLAVGAP
jgi:GDP-L-fucose synthase